MTGSVRCPEGALMLPIRQTSHARHSTWAAVLATSGACGAEQQVRSGATRQRSGTDMVPTIGPNIVHASPGDTSKLYGSVFGTTTTRCQRESIVPYLSNDLQTS